jgi:hypothetical protein
MHKLFTLIFLLWSGGTFATAYYVSSTGSDANSGTSAGNAWATINKVNNTAFLPGDALYFEGGQTFNGNISLTSEDANNADNLFVISSYGAGRATISAGASYGFYAYNTQGFSISNLIFDGGSMSTNTNSGIMLLADVSGDVKFSNISISDIEVKNFGEEGVRIIGGKNLTGYQNLALSHLSVHDVKANGIQIFGYTAPTLIGWPHKNVSVSDCEVYNVPGFADPLSNEGNGIVISEVDGGAIQHCVAHDNGQNNSHCGGPGGIWCWDSNKVTIEFCESYKNHRGTGCDGLGFDLDGGMTNSIIQYNYSHENDGAGYLMGQFENARPWSNNTVRYNISENDGVANEGSIGLFKGPGTTMSGANIYNNTVYVSAQAGNASETAVYFQNWTTGINNVAFYNNIFFSTGGVPLIKIPTGYSAFFENNIYWSSGSSFSIDYQGHNYASLAAWRTATGNEMDAGNNTGYNADPLLANTGRGGTVGFGHSLNTLKAYQIDDISSPAYSTALNLGTRFSIDMGSTDFWGTILPGGNANSIGAGQSSVTLPVELLNFSGNCSGTGDKISWVTGEMLNLKSFDLMYSSDGLHFTQLTEISPKGSNSTYSYLNEQVSAGNRYYELKMTDLDGSVAHSPVLNVHCGKISDKINVWPNPFSQSIHISIESITEGPATIALFDASGKLRSQKKIQIQKGDNQISYDGTDNLPAGAYYLRIIRQGITAHFKLLKSE